MQMLPNGHLNRCKGAVMVQNTVSFDIFFMTLLSQSLDNVKFNDEIESSVSEDAWKFMESYRLDGPTQKTLQLRYDVSNLNKQFNII